MRTKNGLTPKKSLGQNFLVDQNIARKIVAALNLQPDDTVIEIGPGHGALTELLVPKVKKYIGIELDDELASRLNKKYNDTAHFQLIHEDALNVDFTKIPDINTPVKLVGNIPYHITSSLIFNVIEQRRLFTSMTLMIQLEVAERIVALSGSKDYGILSVLSQTFSSPKKLFSVSRNVFFPKPKVTSAVIQWNFPGSTEYEIDDEKAYMRLVKVVFQQRRKMLRTSLKRIVPEKMNDIPIDLSRRPEDLSIREFLELYRAVQKLAKF